MPELVCPSIDSEEHTTLYAEDYVIVVIYFIIILAAGIISTWKSKRDTVKGYFLASRNMHWIPVGASLFASNIGSEHFIGLAGSGAASGIAIASYEMNAIFILMLLGWVFVPVYLASGVCTMPEYLRLRFGGQRIRVLLSVLALLLYVFTKISADLYAGALYIKLALGLTGEAGLYLSILILLVIAAIFTIGGGLSAVIWTDFVQTILMVIGAVVLCVTTLVKVGGYTNLMDCYSISEAEPKYSAFYLDPSTGSNKSCSPIQQNFGHMLRSHDVSNSDLPWTGLFTGMLIASIWYWCADQVIVQRTLSARNVSHGKAAVLLAGTLKFLPLFLLVIPGMAARVLFKNQVGCSDPEYCKKICQSETGCTNIAFIKLVLELMPTGARGLMLAVMMAALMSSLTSVFNSASTIFTIDIWTRFRGKPTDKELLIVGRCFVILLLGVSIAWIPIITNFKENQLFVYVQQVSNFLCPPIPAIFLLALFWHRITEPGAFWGLMAGFGAGIIRFILQFSFTSPACGSGIPDDRPEIIKRLVDDFHYLHFGAFVFLMTGLVCIGVSLKTEPLSEDYIHRLTFWTRFSTTATISPDRDYGRQENINKEQEIREAVESLREKPAWKKTVNICAVGVMSMAAFIYGFFA